MDEYIEREDDIRVVNGQSSLTMTRSSLIDSISKLPAADVVPVVHGRWVDGRCSNCGVDIQTGDAYDGMLWSECRVCYYGGAKRDGGDSDGAD